MAVSKNVLYIDQLYRQESTWLISWLLKRIESRELAADITQDTFERLIKRKRLHQIATIREPRAYLTTIAHGLLADHWRRRTIEKAWLETASSLPHEEIPSPEVQHIILETLTEIDQMLDGLKPAVRKAFLLAQLDGLTGKQIAQQLNVSLATAERYIAKAFRHCYALCYE